MKKIVFTGIILILVMMFVATCEEEPELEVEYTDVEYSPDGSEITLYLDGVGVPVTPAQRAVNKNIAMMAYDYFEVIFVGASDVTTNVARTAWELGAPAGINNVPKPIDYAYGSSKATNIAVMFVGRKDKKTLFGVGFITGTKGTTTAPTATTVDGDTTSVTFSINAIQTGLLVKAETPDPGTGTVTGTQVAGVMANSFDFVALAGATAASPYPTKTDNSDRVTLGGISYPKYTLPQDDGKVVNASYTFSYASSTTSPTNFIKHINTTTTDIPQIMKRVPRFVQSGRYREPGDRWTTLTQVGFNGAYGGTVGTDGTTFNPVVPIQFKLQGSGIFSFYIEIPVYMLTKTVAGLANGGPYTTYETWYIRSGVGSELYSLDDGISNGGCVFMQVGGSSSTSWIDIDWKWL